MLRAVVAFAGTAGGTLLLGVEDKRRRVRGAGDPLALEERLANLISDQIAPQLVPEIEIMPWRRTQVLGVAVHPSSIRPHYLKRKSLDGGTYVRVGSTNRLANAERIFLPVADVIESGTCVVYDDGCGTGGMLTVGGEALQQLAARHGKQVAALLDGREITAEARLAAREPCNCRSLGP